MARRNLCLKDKAVNPKDVWHYDDGFFKSLCGSTSRRNTTCKPDVTCLRCKQILAAQEKLNQILRKITYMDTTQYCDFCGARHRLPTHRLFLPNVKRDFVISLCPHCQKALLDRIEKEKTIE